MSEIRTFEQALEVAAAAGYQVSAADLAAIEEKRGAARLAAPRRGVGAWIEIFNASYPKFLEALHGVGNVMITTAQTLIVSFGVPALLILLLYVEHERVKYGIGLFEAHSTLASLGAWALVLANMSLEFLVFYVEDKAGYHRPHRPAFSLRTMWYDLRYWLGWGRWQPRELSPAHEQKQVLRLVTFAILVLALMGSMQAAMGAQAGQSWVAGLAAIARDSDLLQANTWIGGLLFTLAAVRLAQIMTSYIARRCAEILIAMQHHQEADPTDRIAVQHILAQVARMQQQKAERAAARAAKSARQQAQADEPTDEFIPVEAALEQAPLGR